MEPEEYEILHRVETRHWWYAGMEAISRAILDREHRPPGVLRILDAGCGTGGAMTTYLAGYGTVIGFDLSGLALAFCRQRRAERLARASVVEIPFRSECFDLVTCFEVLYEQGVPGDSAALAEFARVLKRNGRLLLRLPAYEWMRGRHDLAVHTARRYTARQVAGLLRENGLTVEHVSYANMLLFPFAVIKRWSERLLPSSGGGSDLTLDPGPFNGFLRAVLAAEAPLVARLGLPFGLSVIALGRKP